MNKKYLAFGFLGLFSLMLVSATVVMYLSDTSSLDVSVESPFTIGFWDGSETKDTLTLPSVVGGDTFSFETRVESLTSVDADVYLQYVISNGLDNVDIADFGNIEVNVRSDGMGDYSFFDGTFTDFCTFEGLGHGANTCVVDNGDLIINIPNFFFAKEKAEIMTDLQFALNVEPTSYVFDTTILIR
jgi:hypothetical protein